MRKGTTITLGILLLAIMLAGVIQLLILVD